MHSDAETVQLLCDQKAPRVTGRFSQEGDPSKKIIYIHPETSAQSNSSQCGNAPVGCNQNFSRSTNTPDISA